MHNETTGVRVDPAIFRAHAERDVRRRREIVAAVDRYVTEGEDRAARMRAAFAKRHRSAVDLLVDTFTRRAS